jgi:receptor protein-tyrosine kinase
VAVLRETLDTSVKSPEQLKDEFDLPVLGAIPFDKGAAKTPLIDQLDAYSPRIEGFRVLRTNLQFIDPDKSSKVFVITSALPEEGKSTSAINLALVLAQGGERVCLLDGDLRRPMITTYLPLERSVGLTTVLVGRVELDEALQESNFEGLKVLAAGRTPPNPAELLKSHAMTHVLSQLKARFDIILIDAPPLLPVTDAALLADQADGAILVVRHGRTTVDDVRAALDRLHAVGEDPVGAILNMTPSKGGGGYGYGYGYAPDDWPAGQPASKRVKAPPKPATAGRRRATGAR